MQRQRSGPVRTLTARKSPCKCLNLSSSFSETTVQAMAAGTLFSYAENFRAAKALIAAEFSNAKVTVEPNFIFGETNKSKEFLKKFPSGKVPAFESTDGKCLQDSNAIAYFVANEQLRGENDYERAQVWQWVGFGESEILPAGCAWVFPILGIIKKSNAAEEAFVRAKEDMKRALNVLESHLQIRTYLISERVTLADIVISCNLLNLYKYAFDPEFRKGFPNVNRWFLTLVNQPEFNNVLGQITFAEKVHQPFTTGPPQAAANESKNKKKEDKKEKKQQQQQKKEAPKKEKEPPVVEELDAADLALAAEPKSTNPFDELPKGTFNMEDFKRFYSNEEESKSIPYFWEKFDPENYSIWFGEYIYPTQLTKVFMSCNLISGMYQRLDKMRKQAFASVCLFGEDNNSSISGVWVWRGHELAFPLSPDWQTDYESYAWKKLDPASEETKKVVAQYFSWIGEDKKGRKFKEGKIFK